MSFRKMMVGGFVVVIALALWWLLRPFTDPGGPIIVIRPDPEETMLASAVKQDHQCSKPEQAPCWYVGCPDVKHYGNLPDLAVGKTSMDSPPYRFVHLAGVGGIAVALKSQKESIDAKIIELTIDSRTLVIDVPNPNDVPAWTFGTNHLPGNVVHFMPSWPQTLLGKITAVAVTPRGDHAVRKDIPIADLEEIRISYDKSAAYPDCSPQ